MYYQVSTEEGKLHTIMMTYKILTAGARDAKGTIANPAARTAADWTKAAAIRVPTGICSIALTVS
jgi:hypothetical protein